LFIGGDASMNNRLFVSNDVSMNGNLYTLGRTVHQGDVSMNSRLYVNGDASFNNRLFVTGNIYLPTGSSVYVGGAVISTGGGSSNSSFLNDVSMASRLFVYGDVSMGGNLTLSSIGTLTTGFSAFAVSPLTITSTSGVPTTGTFVYSAISDTGFGVAAGGAGVGLYKTNNGGITWSVLNASLTNISNSGGAYPLWIDNTGQYILYILNGASPGIFYSSNYGASFQACGGTLATANTGYNHTLGMAGGSGYGYMMGANVGSNYTSNYGATWTTSAVAPGLNPYGSVGISADGKYMIKLSYGQNQQNVYMSTDYGNNWYIKATVVANNYWYGAISSTGQYSVWPYSATGLYTSSNYGTTWTAVTVTGATISYQQPCFVSGSGQYQYVYGAFSNNYGVTWTASSNYIDAMSRSGKYILKSTGTGLYYRINTIDPQINLGGDASFNGNVSISGNVSMNSSLFLGTVQLRQAIGLSYTTPATTYTPNTVNAALAGWSNSGINWTTTQSSISDSKPLWGAFNGPPGGYFKVNGVYAYTGGYVIGGVTTVITGVGTVLGEWGTLTSNSAIVMNSFNFTNDAPSRFPASFYILGANTTSPASWTPIIYGVFTSLPFTNAVGTTTSTYYIPIGTTVNGQQGPLRFTTYGNGATSFTNFRIVGPNIIGNTLGVTPFDGNNNTNLTMQAWNITFGNTNTNTFNDGTLNIVSNNTDISGTLTSYGTVTTRSDIIANNRLYIQGDVSMNSRLFVNGDVSMNSRLFVSSEVSMNARLFVSNDVSMNGNLYTLGRTILQGDLSLNSRLFVGNDVIIAGRLNVFEYTNRNIVYTNVTTTEYTFIVAEDMSLNGRLNVNFDASLNARLFVGSDVSMNGNLYNLGRTIHQGDVSMNSRLFVFGNIGLGTNNPTYTLDVTGNIRATSTIFSSNNQVATLVGTETLTNKTLTTPIIASLYTSGTNLLTFPASISDNVVTRTSTDTLTNKTLTSPTLTTPVLGVATATSINKVLFTAPATVATLTLAEGSTLTTAANVTHAGAFAQTFTATAATNVTLPTTGTLATIAGTETLTGKTLTTPTITSPAISGTATFTQASQSTSALALYNATNAVNTVNMHPYLNAGSFNNMTALNDSGLFWGNALGSATGGFVIAPWANATTGLRIASNGNVSINTTTSTSTLNVTGTATVTGSATVTTSVSTPSLNSTSLELGAYATDAGPYIDFKNNTAYDYNARIQLTGGTSNAVNGTLTYTAGVHSFVSGNLTVGVNNASTSTTTGSLQVTGGAGISGNLYAANLYSSNGLFIQSWNQPLITAGATQGAYMGWNYTGGQGETDFVNCKGGGSGGFNFYNMASGATSPGTAITTISGTGAISSSSMTLTGTTASTSAGSGTMVLSGSGAGLGVAGNVYVGGNLYSTASSTLSGINYIDRIAELIANPSAGATSFDYSTGSVFNYSLTSSANITANFLNVNPSAVTNRTFVASLIISSGTYKGYVSAVTVSATGTTGSSNTLYFNGGASAISVSSASVIVQTFAFVYTSSGSAPAFTLSNVASYQA